MKFIEFTLLIYTFIFCNLYIFLNNWKLVPFTLILVNWYLFYTWVFSVCFQCIWVTKFDTVLNSDWLKAYFSPTVKILKRGINPSSILGIIINLRLQGPKERSNLYSYKTEKRKVNTWQHVDQINWKKSSWLIRTQSAPIYL